MSPWHIDQAVGVQEFKNDRSLTNEEIDIVVRWVYAGAPRGNPEDMPPPVVFADDVAPLLPKGTVLAFKAWYDNTAGLRGNPDPNQWVGWGDRTVDEMGHAWVNITYLDDTDFEDAVTAREEVTASIAGGGQ